MKSECERCERERVCHWYRRKAKIAGTELRSFCQTCRRALAGKGWHKQTHK